ncbi:hypothetical protein IWX76_001745 [Pedobacter sp. CAN_A7]|uniref:hypothetical protein n=1 Tax=Pedobacter sp. CAN_A7 TaxID=2787722 RepID=UPI0018CAC913
MTILTIGYDFRPERLNLHEAVEILDSFIAPHPGFDQASSQRQTSERPGTRCVQSLSQLCVGDILTMNLK